MRSLQKVVNHHSVEELLDYAETRIHLPASRSFPLTQHAEALLKSGDFTEASEAPLEPDRVPEVNQTRTAQVGPHRRRSCTGAEPPQTRAQRPGASLRSVLIEPVRGGCSVLDGAVRGVRSVVLWDGGACRVVGGWGVQRAPGPAG